MLLFNKLNESDQENVIHYCLHLVIEDMLEDGVQLEPYSEEDRRIKEVLERVIAEAEALPEDQQFEFVAHHEEAGQLVFDIALDMARSAFYPTSDELVINFEQLRDMMEGDDHDGEEVLFEDDKPTKKDTSVLN